MVGQRPDTESIGLPFRVFLFTIDQIATMLVMDEQTIKRSHLFYDGVSTGRRPRDRMIARNVAPDGEKPEWRVAESELVRWCKSKGFKLYDRGWPQF